MFPPDWVPIDERIVDGVNRFYDGEGTFDLYGNRVEDGHPDYHPYRYFHDFSYAGYHRGDDPIPAEDPAWEAPRIFDVTQWPYQLDPTTAREVDCTPAIQQAIDDAEAAGGGVVYLPPGEYRIASHNANNFLSICESGVVLRGAGPDETKLLVDPYVDGEFSMYRKVVISVQGGKLWQDSVRLANWRIPITADLPFPTRVIPVRDAAMLGLIGQGAGIAIVGKRTEAFLAEHDMKGTWPEHRPAYLFRREIVSVDTVARTVTLDVPTRYRIRLTDEPEVVLIPPGISEVGLESFSIGMIRHPEEWDYTGSIFTARDTRSPASIHDLWQNRLFRFLDVSDAWLYNLRSYCPDENVGRPVENRLTGQRFGLYDVEVLNEVLILEQSRNITVKNLHFKNAQVDSGSANGYAIRVSGSDNLLENVVIEKMKKGFAIMDSWASGNVIKDCVTRDPLDAADVLHWELSPANLIDNHTLDGGYWSSVIQGMDDVEQGHSSSHTVFWNLRGLREPDTGIKTVLDRDNDSDGFPDFQESHGDLPDVGLVISNQFGWGYVIGTYGPFADVLTPRIQRAIEGDWSRPHVFPKDYSEGIGYDPRTVGLLEPRSLYEAQLTKRLEAIGRPRNLPPWALIQSASPTLAMEGERVSLYGRGADADGAVIGFEWTSDIDGVLSTMPFVYATSLSPGEHEISFRVLDDQGEWSRSDTVRIEIRRPLQRVTIIDNGEPGTSFTGRWRHSAGSDPFGDSSLYSRDTGAAYRYRIADLEPAFYAVSLHWTVVAGRCESVPVDIAHAWGSSRVTVNQRQGGSEWVSLGVYILSDVAAIEITSAGNGSTCADAVKLERLELPPGFWPGLSSYLPLAR